jgi:chitinase
MKHTLSLAGLAVLIAQCSAQFDRRRNPPNYCPATCDVLGPESGNWHVYSSVQRLSWCNQTMLVSFSMYNDIDDAQTTVKISACTAGSSASSSSSLSARNVAFLSGDAPSDSASSTRGVVHGQARFRNLTAGSATNSSAPAWMLNTEITVDVQQLSAGNTGASFNSDLVSAASALRQQLSDGKGVAGSNKTLSLAYSNGAIVGVYSGERILDDSTHNLLQDLIDTVTNGSTANTIVMQVCGDDRNAHGILGVIAHADPDQKLGDLGAIQDALAAWNNATCVTLDGSSLSTFPMTVHQSASSVRTATVKDRDTTCSAIQVVSGDTCASLATECGLSGYQFTVYNPSSTECSTLVPGEWVCCSSGSLPDYAPSPQADGTCYTYYVVKGDTCSALAATYTLTIAEIESFNTETWGWMGCDDLLAEMNICLSTGNPPMPATLSNAVCGPQVPGTSAPVGSETLSDLNPCKLNACCDIWGQCGTTAEFCTASESTTGAPGTAAANENGCISNCGTQIVNQAIPPASFMKIAYFEGFNWGRPCLNMEALYIPSTYTHIHFAFAVLTSDFQVSIAGMERQFAQFQSLTTQKRIISIGGWAFSTDPATYNIFREGVTSANVITLATNVAAFVVNNGLDGVDIDWEYPGEPDIPGIPAGNDDDGLNYAIFMAYLRIKLPLTKTISFAAPASYWYLKQFELVTMADFADYIVYMTVSTTTPSCISTTTVHEPAANARRPV